MYVIGYLTQYINSIAAPGNKRFGALAYLVYGDFHVTRGLHQETVTLQFFQFLHIYRNSYGKSTLHDGHDKSFPPGLFLRQPCPLRHSVIISMCACGRRQYPVGKLLGIAEKGLAQQQQKEQLAFHYPDTISLHPLLPSAWLHWLPIPYPSSRRIFSYRSLPCGLPTLRQALSWHLPTIHVLLHSPHTHR